MNAKAHARREDLNPKGPLHELTLKRELTDLFGDDGPGPQIGVLKPKAPSTNTTTNTSADLMN